MNFATYGVEYNKRTVGKKIAISFETECPFCKEKLTYSNIDLNEKGIIINEDIYESRETLGIKIDCTHCKKEIVVQITDN